VIEPDDTEVLDASNEAILTLVTCYPFSFVGSAPKRFIVRAHRVPPGADLESEEESNWDPRAPTPRLAPDKSVAYLGHSTVVI